MFARISALATLAALAGSASALQILVPGGDSLWWVANSMNMIAWTCHDNPYNNFTIVMANNNTALLTAPQPIVSVESNYDCSKSIAANQATQLPGTGYYLQFANALNSTDVWATSQPFEIKASGSPYPDASATPAGAATGGAASATSTGAGAGTTGAAASGGSTGTASGSGAASSPSAKSGAAALGISTFTAGAAVVLAVAALA